MTDKKTCRQRATILLVDDMPANLNILRRVLRQAEYRILASTNGAEALDVVAAAPPDLILMDVMMPGMSGFEVCQRLKDEPTTAHIPIIFITAREEKEGLIQGFEAGGVDYIRKPFEEDEVQIRVRTHLEIARLNTELRRKNAELEAEIARRQTAESAQEKADARLAVIAQEEAKRVAGFVGRSPSIQQILAEVAQLQEVKGLSVLVTGESGTGKELVAQALHFGSSRAKGPFVTLNCGAINAQLAESTLFGHVKGAFTGATENRKGCFEQADGGTLFLDEIGDMPLDLQVKLLRVLEGGRLTPVGGTAEQEVDVHVVAATNADLSEAISQGTFRQDLYFRLAQCRVEVPPLRQRPGDIPLLAAHFLVSYATDMELAQPTLTPEALGALRAYAFPGNVRELKNMMAHALIRSSGGPIAVEHLQFHEALAPGQATAGEEEQILAYVQRQESIGNTECRQLLAVDKRHASYVLDKMLAKGLLQRQGTGRWTRYRLKS